MDKRPPKTTFSDSNYSLSASKEASDVFQSAKSSFSKDNVDHYSASLVSNSNDYFFDLNQKDYVYKNGKIFQDNLKSKSCFGPCFKLNDKINIIDLQESQKKKNSKCLIF